MVYVIYICIIKNHYLKKGEIMNELMMWDLYWSGATAAGTYFFGIAFLAWVGLRISNNIYNNTDSNMVVKVAGSAFCLSVAYFMLVNGAWFDWMSNGTAAGLVFVSENSEMGISPGAEAFIANSNPGADFNLIPNPVQGIFIASLLTLQLGQIWTNK